MSWLKSDLVSINFKPVSIDALVQHIKFKGSKNIEIKLTMKELLMDETILNQKSRTNLRLKSNRSMIPLGYFPTP